MKLRRRKLLTEPPHSATSDIAFILIVFFLVCAAVQPDSGRPQAIPRGEEEKDKESKNVEVSITREAVILDGEPLGPDQFRARIESKLSGKKRDEERVVLVKSARETPYHWWIQVTDLIEQANGIVTLQIEEERTIAL